MSMNDPGAGAANGLSGLHFSPTALPPPGTALAPSRSRLRQAIAARMGGPGGYYNTGNAVGLVAGISLAVWTSGAIGGHGGATAAAAYLTGSGSALALTGATLIFFWSGEVYHRAWADPDRPDPRLNRQGDFLSAIGAVALGLSMALLGLPLLAATAGGLHALGKLGSVLHRPGLPACPGWRATWPDPFRSLVLLSRAPALLVAALALAAGLSAAQPAEVVAVLLGPGVLLVCNLLWARADLLLFRPAG